MWNWNLSLLLLLQLLLVSSVSAKIKRYTLTESPPSVTPRYHGHTYDKSDYNPDRQNLVVPLVVGAVIMGIILVILLCIRCIHISPLEAVKQVELTTPSVQSPPIFPDAPSPRDLHPYLSSSPRPSAFPPSVVPKHHYYHFPEGKDDFHKPHHSHRVWTSVFIAVAAFFFLLILYVIVRKVVKKFSVVPGQGLVGLELGHLSPQEERQDPSPSSPSSPQ